MNGSGGPARVLNFVAHPDDDLLFMNPDILGDIRAGNEVTTVYLTSGDARRGLDYATARIRGARAAYARMAGEAEDWRTDVRQHGESKLSIDSLAGTRIRLVPLGIRAAVTLRGDPEGDLHRLWQNSSFVATTIDGAGTYTRQSLTQTLRALLREFRPTYLRVQDREQDSGANHVDHISGSLLVSRANTYAAEGRHYTRYREIEYVDYAIRTRTANVSPGLARIKEEVFDTYAVHDDEVKPGEWTSFKDKQYVRSMRCPDTLWQSRWDPQERDYYIEPG